MSMGNDGGRKCKNYLTLQQSWPCCLLQTRALRKLPSTNAERGCVMLDPFMEEMDTKRAQITCRELKNGFGGNVANCALGIILTLNRGSESDITRVYTGCAMITNDISEKEAKVIAAQFISTLNTK
jgi:hypothetical protein